MCSAPWMNVIFGFVLAQVDSKFQLVRGTRIRDLDPGMDIIVSLNFPK